MVSRRAWTIASLLARLLMVAVVTMSVRFILVNYTRYTYVNNYNELASNRYALATGIMGLAGTLLQIPLAIYLLCKSNKMMASVLLLDISMYADMVISLVLASGVGAGFGASNDVKRYVNKAKWNDPSVPADLNGYFDRAIVATAFLLAGLFLSACAAVTSTKLRIRAHDAND